MRAGQDHRPKGPEHDGIAAPARPAPLTDAELETLAVAELQEAEAALWPEIDATAQAIFLERLAEESNAPPPEPKGRRGPDGLTPAQRRSLYEPTRYQVEELGPAVWVAMHQDVPALFVARAVNADWTRLEIRSNTGHRWEVERTAKACPCPDHEKAKAEERRCKHLAVAEAVWAVVDIQRAERQEDRFEIARRQMAAECERLLALLREGELEGPALTPDPSPTPGAKP